MRIFIELRSMIAASSLGHILFSAWVDGVLGIGTSEGVCSRFGGGREASLIGCGEGSVVGGWR